MTKHGSICYRCYREFLALYNVSKTYPYHWVTYKWNAYAYFLHIRFIEDWLPSSSLHHTMYVVLRDQALPWRLTIGSRTLWTSTKTHNCRRCYCTWSATERHKSDEWSTIRQPRYNWTVHWSLTTIGTCRDYSVWSYCYCVAVVRDVN